MQHIIADYFADFIGNEKSTAQFDFTTFGHALFNTFV